MAERVMLNVNFIFGLILFLISATMGGILVLAPGSIRLQRPDCGWVGWAFNLVNLFFFFLLIPVAGILQMMEVELDPAVEAFKINQGQTGFYRVKYLEEEALDTLGNLAAGRKLEPVDRWGIQNDLYALLRCGDVSIDAYLEFLNHYAEEDAYLPLVSIADNLHHAYLVFEGEKRERVATLGRTLLERVLGRIGYEPAEGESHTTSVLRDQIKALREQPSPK